MAEEIDLTMKSLSKNLKNAKVRESVRKVLTDLRKYVASDRTKLVPLHGDFAPQNIVVSQENENPELRILDFERARIGDNLWDYAYYYGWLQRTDLEAAVTWRRTVEESCSKEEIKMFDAFVILFHAWTIRDIFDYKKNTLRAARGEKSIKLLESLF
jgi:thiamine kinase-like enzyme